jgi:malate dehydrogenase (oxaloacetate-decarboxylating)
MPGRGRVPCGATWERDDVVVLCEIITVTSSPSRHCGIETRLVRGEGHRSVADGHAAQPFARCDVVVAERYLGWERGAQRGAGRAFAISGMMIGEMTVDPHATARRYHVAPDGSLETTLRGAAVLSDPVLSKGSAFPAEERHALGLTGLLPPAITTLDEQVGRVYARYHAQPDDLAKYAYLRALHDRNEVLFYAVLSQHLREMLPIVYTPTVGDAIAHFSHRFQRPRGVYLSIEQPSDIALAFQNFGAGPDDIDLIVATDAEAILGIGDWGVGGIDIAVGKLAVYTAAAGISPLRVVPVMLDVGTDRESLLSDPSYLGYRHARVRGDEYDAFIEEYVNVATRLFPHAILHWEDFGPSNARRILTKYRNRVCTFNDDIQGTGATALAAVLSAARDSGVPLRDQRIVIFGPGTAGVGIVDQLADAMVRDGLSRSEATRRFWCVGRHGLLVDTMAPSLRDFQVPLARPAAEVARWEGAQESTGIPLLEVVRRVHPTVLIGTSAIPGAFTESVVREMASGVERPVIFPMSNPTDLSEAVPADLLEWTEGRALIAGGSPFAPVTYRGTTYVIAQANNALLFPGIVLGTLVSRARSISDGMFAAAAQAVAGMVDVGQPGGSLLPHVEDLRPLSATVAVAVAEAAAAEGLARTPLEDVRRQVQDAMWQPVYRRVTATSSR